MAGAAASAWRALRGAAAFVRELVQGVEGSPKNDPRHLGRLLASAFATKTEQHLNDDSCRRSRAYVIGIWGLAFAFKLWKDVPAYGCDWFAIAVLLAFAQGLAFFSRGRATSLLIDYALVVLAWVAFHKRTEILSRPDQFSGETRGAHVVAAFVVFQSVLILSGTSQRLVLIWDGIVYNTCWLTDDPAVHETFILMSVIAHSFAFILQNSEAQKWAEKQRADERWLEHKLSQAKAKEKYKLEQARAEERQKRIEYSLSLVFQQLKPPLLLLVSDLKNADVSPEMAQLTVRMLTERVGQIWELFTGLGLRVDEEAKAARAREAEKASDLSTGELGGSAPEAPTLQAEAPDEPAAAAGLPAAALPERRAPPSGRASSRSSSRASSRPREPLPTMPAVGRVRVLFDALSQRGDMQEITLFFEKQAKPLGLYDWVQQEHSARVSIWIQEAVNAWVAGLARGQEGESAETVINGVRFQLPWACGSASFEATSVALRSLACESADADQPGRASEGPAEGSGSGGEEADAASSNTSLEKQGGDSEETEEKGEEDEREEGDGEEGFQEEVVGVVELAGILWHEPTKHRRKKPLGRAWASSLGSVGEEKGARD